MSCCVVGDDEFHATYFNNCPDCNLQIDNYGFKLKIVGNTVTRMEKLL